MPGSFPLWAANHCDSVGCQHIAALTTNAESEYDEQIKFVEKRKFATDFLVCYEVSSDRQSDEHSFAHIIKPGVRLFSGLSIPTVKMHERPSHWSEIAKLVLSKSLSAPASSAITTLRHFDRSKNILGQPERVFAACLHANTHVLTKRTCVCMHAYTAACLQCKHVKITLDACMGVHVCLALKLSVNWLVWQGHRNEWDDGGILIPKVVIEMAARTTELGELSSCWGGICIGKTWGTLFKCSSFHSNRGTIFTIVWILSCASDQYGVVRSRSMRTVTVTVIES